LVHSLRELGVLFERGSDGDYLHIYTESFADRFFFEIVRVWRAECPGAWLRKRIGRVRDSQPGGYDGRKGQIGAAGRKVEKL
jgi:hypothetical protein